MEKRLAEKMDSLDVQAEATCVVCTNPNPIGNQFCYHGRYGVCLSHFLCQGRLIV